MSLGYKLSDITYDYTAVPLLLTGDDLLDHSSVPKTITNNGSVAVSTSTYKYGTGSLSFNGTNQYLTVDATPDGFSGDFTVEGWCNITGYSPEGFAILVDARGADLNGLMVYMNAGAINVNSNSNQTIITGTAPAFGVWFHYAVCRSGSSVRLFINGVQVGSTATYSSAYPANTWFLGCFKDQFQYTQGYFDDFRITVGFARYTANFTPPTSALPFPTAAGDTSWSSVSFLMNGEDLNDKSPTPKMITNNGVTVAPGFGKYGTGSLQFNSAWFNYLSAATNSAFAFGTGDATVELWVKFTSFATTPAIIDTRISGASSNGLLIAANASGGVVLYDGGAAKATSSNLSLNTWYHMAYVRSGTTNTFYINGAVVGTAYTLGTNFTDNFLTLGARVDFKAANNSFKLDGFIDEVRITKGVARYTAPFTPAQIPATQVMNPVDVDDYYITSDYLIDIFPKFSGIGIYDQVLSVGSNNSGQLGLSVATGSNYSTFQTVPGVTGIKQVAGGFYHTLALKTDGTLLAAGANGKGQLGLNVTTTSSYSTFQTVPGVTGIKQIAVGASHSIVLKTDGTLLAVGYNSGAGQLGLGNTAGDYSAFQTVPSITGVKQISCGYRHSFALKVDGTLLSCGYGFSGSTGLGNTAVTPTFTSVPSITGVKQIACGGRYYTIALKTDGTLLSCGYNNKGNLGLGNTTNYSTFQTVPGVTGIKQIGAGHNHTIVLKTDGTLLSCGTNNFGQLGIGSTTSSNYSTFQTVPGITGIKQISCGYQHTLALKTDGTLLACGRNQQGQLCLNNTTNYSTFQTVPSVTGIKQIATGNLFTHALLAPSILVS